MSPTLTFPSVPLNSPECPEIIGFIPLSSPQFGHRIGYSCPQFPSIWSQNWLQLPSVPLGSPIGIGDTFGDRIVTAMTPSAASKDCCAPVLWLSRSPFLLAEATVLSINNSPTGHGIGPAMGNPAYGWRAGRPIHIPNGGAQQASAFGLQRLDFC
jgi:hypothetical protein